MHVPFGAAAVVLVLFGIIGVHLFAGKYYFCSDPMVADRASCVGTFINSAGVLTARVWMKPQANFDDIGRVCLSVCPFDLLAARTSEKPQEYTRQAG
jgi:hypothetical protein